MSTQKGHSFYYKEEKGKTLNPIQTGVILKGMSTTAALNW